MEGSTGVEPGRVGGRLVELLAGRGETLAAAESLTGGLVTAAMTEAPGSSRVVLGGVVAYAPDVKVAVLGVEPHVIEAQGVVSQECAAQMAQGVRRLTGADWGLATTGEAGPDPSGDAPVGSVWIGVAGPGVARTVHTDLSRHDDRDAIRAASVDAVLDLAVSVVSGMVSEE